MVLCHANVCHGKTTLSIPLLSVKCIPVMFIYDIYLNIVYDLITDKISFGIYMQI